MGVQVYLKDGKQKYGGIFLDELNAAKRVNQLCEEVGIPPKNPDISAIPNQERQRKAGKEKRSQYKQVYWNRINEKWFVNLYCKDGKQKYGGLFNNELDAAKRVNQLCAEAGIPPKNPGLNAIPNQQRLRKETTSKYPGVWWNKTTGNWCVQLYLKGNKHKYGGQFIDELDAAKRVNQICQEAGIPSKIPGIGDISLKKRKRKKRKRVETNI